jgi:hypothetical protein
MLFILVVRADSGSFAANPLDLDPSTAFFFITQVSCIIVCSFDRKT